MLHLYKCDIFLVGVTRAIYRGWRLGKYTVIHQTGHTNDLDQKLKTEKVLSKMERCYKSAIIVYDVWK